MRICDERRKVTRHGLTGCLKMAVNVVVMETIQATPKFKYPEYVIEIAGTGLGAESQIEVRNFCGRP